MPFILFRGICIQSVSIGARSVAYCFGFGGAMALVLDYRQIGAEHFLLSACCLGGFVFCGWEGAKPRAAEWFLRIILLILRRGWGGCPRNRRGGCGGTQSLR